MAQPNVAREPSMEEILASIRRIIENNDPVESIDNASYSSSSAGVPETIELTIDDDIALMTTGAQPVAAPFAAAEPAESPAAQRTPEKIEQPAARPMSLADVAARVKAASERRAPAAPANDTERQPASVPAPAMVEQRHEPVDAQTTDTSHSAMQFGEQDASFHAAFEAAPAPAFHAEEAALNPFEFVNDAPEPADDTFAEDAGQDAIERFAAQIGNEIAASVPAQLLSPVTEEKVSRSFEELADALGGSKRSLDEIAEDMLKPMLQEWLDDNLPTLVERLVREEIERVARGPRR